MSEKENKIFTISDGLPTRPDVDLLMKTWPAPKVGDEFSYELIEKILGIDYKSQRWKTVTSAWRRRWLGDHGVVINAKAGKSFYVASPDQISSATHQTLTYIAHKAHKQRRKLATVRPENDLQKRTIEHHSRLLHVLQKETKKACMNLLPETSVKALPDVSKTKSA